MIELLQGDCCDVLPTLPAGSVQCVVTSPPYYALRDYGLPPTQWPTISYTPLAGLPPITIPGCDGECDHQWGPPIRAPWANANPGPNGRKKNTEASRSRGTMSGESCEMCGGWRGSLGLEPDPLMFVGHLVHIFRLIWRVLRNDGTCWINLGDSYSAGGNGGGGRFMAMRAHKGWGFRADRKGFRAPPEGIKDKDLLGIPWRVALALQADGWYLRCDIVWHKPNPMPESVTDRPTRAHEYLFLLSKSERYYYDAEAIKEAVKQSSIDRVSQPTFDQQTGGPKDYGANSNRSMRKTLENFAANGSVSRNRRSVWTISTTPYKDAHFATFPESLVEPCILAGSGSRACEVCGAAWVRQIETRPALADDGKTCLRCGKNHGAPKIQTAYTEHRAGKMDVERFVCNETITTGWQQTCTCSSNGTGRSIVLDPFAGSGTTLRVAERLGRDSIGIELNGDYIKLQEKRTDGVQVEMEL